MITYRYMVDDIFSSITHFGMPAFYVLVILALFKFQAAVAWQALGALLLVEVVCILIKLAYPKERPQPRQRTYFLDGIYASSFPSVHSARAAVLATLCVWYIADPLYSALAILLALGVGYSRIYLKHHDVKDVAAGLAAGVIFTMLVLYL